MRVEGATFDTVCGRDPPEWAGECVVGVVRFKRRGQEQAHVRLGLWEWPVQQGKVGRIGVDVFRSVVEIYRFWLGSSLHCPASLSKSPLWLDFLEMTVMPASHGVLRTK